MSARATPIDDHLRQPAHEGTAEQSLVLHEEPLEIAPRPFVLANVGVQVVSLPRLLDVDEVAGALGVSRWSIYRWCAEGRIPCIRAGRKVRFILAEVVAALRDPGRARLPSYVPPPPPHGCRVAAARPEPEADPAERMRAAVDATRALRR